MRASVYRRYGTPDVLGIEEVESPVPADGEVLVRVHASSVNVADWIFLTGRPRVVRLFTGLFRPKRPTLGHDLAGRIEAVGDGVDGFRVGDEVYGRVDRGAWADRVVASRSLIAMKPANLTFEQAASVPLAAMTALQGLRDTGRLRAGQHVLVNGASGGVGTFAVQIAKALGAEVTGVCRTGNLEMVRGIGADHVIDYTEEAFTGGDRRYDLIFDLVGSRPLGECRRALTPGGLYVSSAGRISWVLRVALASLIHKQVKSMPTEKTNTGDLLVLKDMIEAGRVTPVIERTCDLTELPEALRRQGEGHARGKTVIVL